MFSQAVCHKARISRDPRFDGQFFTAVHTTKIYCRPICPATPPKETNVTYFFSAIAAAQAGYRPCLRCRPDSAPGSSAWKGTDTTFERALALIDQGVLQEGTLSYLAERLGISDRYLRKLFDQQLGVSPKVYALYQQCLFAKQLLHQTHMPITQVALASGFNSVRRFNDCFRSELGLTPTQVRRSDAHREEAIRLQLSFRPPFNWPHFSQFLSARAIERLEWCGPYHYGRTFSWRDTRGFFTAHFVKKENKFAVDIVMEDIRHLKAVVKNMRRVLDLDADSKVIDKNLKKAVGNQFSLITGLRLPGIWDEFEAGARAILGQQVSVKAAHHLVSTLVNELGYTQDGKRWFPSAAAVADSDLAFLKMPTARRQTLRELAAVYRDKNTALDPNSWLNIKGIGPWTVDYAKLRGCSYPDIYLGGDLGVKKVAGSLPDSFNPASASPWRSYLTLQLWSQL